MCLLENEEIIIKKSTDSKKCLKIKLKVTKQEYAEFLKLLNEYNTGVIWAFNHLDYQEITDNGRAVYLKCQHCSDFSDDIFLMRSTGKLICKKCLYYLRTGERAPDIRLRSTKKIITQTDIQQVCALPLSDMYDAAANYAYDLHKMYLKTLKTNWRTRKPAKIEMNSFSVEKSASFKEKITENGKSKIYAGLTIYSERKFFLCLDKNDYHYRFLRAIITTYKTGITKYRSQIYIDERKKKVYLIFPFREPAIIVPEYSPDMTPIGIDLGINKMAVLSVMSDTSFKDITFLHHGALLHKRNKKISIRKSLGHQKKNRAIKAMIKKENIYNRYIAHCISKKIIDTAQKYQNPVIVFEDLANANEGCVIHRKGGKKVKRKDLKTHNRNISSWNRGMILDSTKYKAKYLGIPLIVISAFYTSQTCSKCGHISKANRKTQANFKCVSCGYSVNADLNASFNLSKRFKIMAAYASEHNQKLTEKYIEKTFTKEFWKTFDYSKCSLYVCNSSQIQKTTQETCECGV